MKVLAPFVLLTSIIWNYGLQSPEENNPSVSYAGTLPKADFFGSSLSQKQFRNQTAQIKSFTSMQASVPDSIVVD